MTIVTSSSSLYKSSDMDYSLQNLIFVSLTFPTLQHDIPEQIPIATDRITETLERGLCRRDTSIRMELQKSGLSHFYHLPCRYFTAVKNIEEYK